MARQLNMYVNRAYRGVMRNGDIIMTIAALFGLVSTAVMVARETPRALDILDDLSLSLDRIDVMEEHNDIHPLQAQEQRKALKLDATKKLVKNYAPAGIALISTGACIIGSNHFSRTRNAALSGLLNASNIAYNEYREHVRQAIGEKKETAIYDDIRKEHIEKLPPPKKETDIYNTGNGNTLCHIEVLPGDPTTGIYFLSSPEAVQAAINDANAEGIESGYVSMEDLLYFLKLKVPGGGTSFYGWQITSRNDLIQIRKGSHLFEDGRPVLDIGFYNYPYKGFDRFG